MKRDFLTGVLLVNTIPHTVMGLAGKRLLTPLGGPGSSPRTNLVWAATNLAGAALLFRGWRTTDQPDAERRLRTVQHGMLAMTVFGSCYELLASRRCP